MTWNSKRLRHELTQMDGIVGQVASVTESASPDALFSPSSILPMNRTICNKAKLVCVKKSESSALFVSLVNKLCLSQYNAASEGIKLWDADQLLIPPQLRIRLSKHLTAAKNKSLSDLDVVMAVPSLADPCVGLPWPQHRTRQRSGFQKFIPSYRIHHPAIPCP